MNKASLTLDLNFSKFHPKSKFSMKLYHQSKGEISFEYGNHVNLTLDAGSYRLHIKNGAIKKVVDFSLVGGESVKFRLSKLPCFISISIFTVTIVVWSEYWDSMSFQSLVLSGVFLSIFLLFACCFLDNFILVRKI